MSDFPCFDSDISVSGLNVSIHTELVPSGTLFKINTFVTSSDGAKFSFNSGHGESFSAEDVRRRHELITGKVQSIFSHKAENGTGNNVDFAAMYMKKDFRHGAGNNSKISENIRKILVFEDE